MTNVQFVPMILTEPRYCLTSARRSVEAHHGPGAKQRRAARFVATSSARLLIFVLVVLAYLCKSGSTTAAQQNRKAIGLDPKLSLQQYHLRGWSLKNGMPTDQVDEIVQTKDGYLWLATPNGLSRFDGARFTNFNRSNSPAFKSNSITCLYEGNDGALWIGTNRGGVIRCRRGANPQFEHYEQLDGRRIQAFGEDRTGKVWIGTDIETWTIANDQCMPRPDAPINVVALCRDNRGKLWLGNSNWYVSRPESVSEDVEPSAGLYCLHDDNFTRVKAADKFLAESEDYSILSMCPSDRGGVWIGTSGHILLRCENEQTIKKVTPIVDGQPLGYKFLLEDRVGDLWTSDQQTQALQRLAIDGRGLLVETQREWNARCAAEDREGNIFFGDKFGLHCLSNPEFIVLDLGTRGSNIKCVTMDEAGQLWFGSGQGGFQNPQTGLHLFDNSVQKHLGFKDGLPSYHVTGLDTGADGRLWIGTENGLACHTEGKLKTITTADGLASNVIRTVFEDSAGVIWIGFIGGGLQQMKDGKLTHVSEFGDNDANWIHEDHKGIIWVGSNRGLFKWAGSQLERVRDVVLDALPTIDFAACYEDEQGVIWLGTDGGGLCSYVDQRFANWTTKDGLYEDSIFAINEDETGRLWLGGPSSLTSLPKVSLGQRKNGTLGRINVSHYGNGAGTEPLRFREKHWPNSVRREDGSVCFVTANGPIVIRADGPHRNSVPALVHIEDVRLDGNSLGPDNDFQILSGRNRLEFHFSASNFTAPERTKFEYKLDGHDDRWMEAIESTTVSFTDLKPGKYTFRVRADNGFGVWSETAAKLPFEILPRWFETYWFRIVSVLGLIGLVAFSTRRYTRSVRLRNEELQQEIDERKLAEKKLSWTESRFRDLAESTQAIPWEADAVTMRFSLVGDKAVDVLGYSAEQWREEDFWIEHLHPEGRLEATEFRQSVIAGGRRHQFEYRMIAADGSNVWLHEVLEVVTEDGVASRLRGFLIDVTDRRHAEEQASDYLQQLSRLNRAASLGEMATSIAHEVKQPLFAIVGNAQITKRLLDLENPDIKEIREALGDIVSDGNRASKIIDHVRALVRKEQSPTERLDLNDVAQDAIQFIAPEIRKRGLVLKTDLADPLPVVNGRSIELHQVILNLINNAIQSMREANNGPNELVLRTTTQNGFVELSIEDHGVGIDADQANRLFEPFFTTKPQGTGMGLAINRTIIEAHQGRIWAKPNDQIGATFSFRLPVAMENDS